MTELSLADHVCLALIAERTTHGWAIVKLLAPGADIGRIWSLSRPLTYRSIDRLVASGLVDRTETGRRAQLRITRRGRRVHRRWLDRPVAHLRDLRTEFLLKVELRRRAGNPIDDLVTRQAEQLAPAIDALTDTHPDDPVALWRHESAEAARRFLDRLRDVEMVATRPSRERRTTRDAEPSRPSTRTRRSTPGSLRP